MSCDSNAASEKFTIIWRIENISFATHDEGIGTLDSPPFVVEMFDFTEYVIRLYPRGDEEKQNILCHIVGRRPESGINVELERIKLCCETSILTPMGIKKGKEETHAPTGEEEFEFHFVDEDDELTLENLCLPGDTLTLQLVMWRCRDKPLSTENALAVNTLSKFIQPKTFGSTTTRDRVPSDIFLPLGQGLKYLKRRFCPYPNRIFARTRIGVDRRNFMWSFKDFRAWKTGSKVYIPTVSASNGGIPLILAVYPIALASNDRSSELQSDDESDDVAEEDGDTSNDVLPEEHIQIDIQRVLLEEKKSLCISCRVDVLDHRGRPRELTEQQHLFVDETDDIWHMPQFLTKKQLLDENDVCLPDDVLTLQFHLTISDGIESSKIEESSFYPLDRDNPFKRPRGTNNSFRPLYNDRKFCDMVLRAGGKEFHAHKGVLCTRSPVFCAMFENNMKEKVTGVVEIEDMDAETMERLLLYVYSDAMNDMDFESGKKLYVAANKYIIAPLKEDCSSFLESKLTIDNACETLVLGDVHGDIGLKLAARNFIANNAHEIIISRAWKDFTKEHYRLAGEVTHYICLLMM